MRRKLFKYKAVYYLAVTASFLLLFYSFKAIISLSINYNLLKLIFVPSAFILNLVTFINLIIKHQRSLLFLNISLCLFIILTGRSSINDILDHGSLFEYSSYKYFLSFLTVLIIVNKYKTTIINSENEIDNIGTHND